MNTTSHRLPRRAALIAAASGAAALIAGCGLHNPNTASLSGPSTTAHKPSNPAQPATVTTAQGTPGLAPNAGGPKPQAAIEQYARLWCNWTSGTLLAHERKLLALSVGGAHSLEQAALATASESHTHITNRCTIESLSTGQGDAAGKWVLVTSSTTTTPVVQGLAPQFHVTYATVVRSGRRYLVNAWMPQS